MQRPKFELPTWVVQELLAYIRHEAAWIVVPGDPEAVARDPTDDKFLAAAAIGQADWLVSADRDLLDIGEYQGIPIISPWEFLPLL